MGGQAQLSGPDLEQGVAWDSVPDGGSLVGHAGGEAVLLARRGAEIFAIGATCTHYGGPLGEGLVVGDTVRCPWHHACFSLRTGEALRAPALNPVACFKVERRGDKVHVTGKVDATPRRTPASPPSSIVIVGAGAAGNAAAEMLRREGYDGPITMLGADPSGPYDRPNLSKDYLAGNAPEEWIPLRPPEFYTEQRIQLRTGTPVTRIDPKERKVVLASGETLPYGALLLATGAEPRRLNIPGANLPHVHVLRTLADSRAIIEKAKKVDRVVVIGASFIGLEVAASLRTRGVAVDIVAPDGRPLERVLGPELAEVVRNLHQERGVTFHLRQTPVSIDAAKVTLSSGAELMTDLVVLGVGVTPATALAEQAGLAMDRGVKVNEHLETSVPGIFAAGDIARWPDPHTGEAIRVEHWVLAERQAQTAARNMLGARERFDAVPFFWSAHYDLVISYTGHAESWDRVEIDGDPKARDCRVTYFKNGKRLAVATIGRDRESLRAEAEMEASAAR